MKCKACKKMKPASAFYATSGRTCKQCVGARSRKNYNANKPAYRLTRAKWWEKNGSTLDKKRYATRGEWRDKLKDKPCSDCGEKYPPYVMDWDHVRGRKLFDVGTAMGGRSEEQLLKEIAKCDLVCANCHRIRTHQRRHGDAAKF